MGLDFTIDVDGVREFDRSFNRIRRHINDLFPVWREVQAEFFFIERRQFRTEGAAGASGRWKALSPKYAAWKLKRYGPKPILERTGRLLKSLTNQSPDTIRVFGRREAIFGSRVPYGRYHQRGGGRLPQRKPIDPTTEQKRDLQKAIQRGLVKIIRKDPSVELEVD